MSHDLRFPTARREATSEHAVVEPDSIPDLDEAGGNGGPGLEHDVPMPDATDLDLLELPASAGADDERAPAGGDARPAPTSRFRLYTADELLKLPPPTWLLHEHVPEGALAVLFGPPGVGKSFLALAWALSIATQTPWLRWATRWGPILYVAAEGGAGLVQRVQIYRDAHESTRHPDKVRFVREAVNLLADGDVDALLASWASLELGLKPALVVFDTLSRCMPGGDENSAQDVGRVIAATDRIRRATDAAVLLVHHTGKDGLQERGSSALRGAADVMFSLRAEDATLVLACEKQKDAPAVDPQRLRLVPIGASCVIEAYDARTPTTGLTRHQVQLLETLKDVVLDGTAAVTTWVRTSQVPERSAYRAIDGLLERALVQRVGKRYELTAAGDVELAVRRQGATT